MRTHHMSQGLGCKSKWKINAFTSDSSCIAVERRLLKSGVVTPPKRHEDDSDDDSLTPLEHLRQKVYCSQLGHDSADEDSDFD